MQSGGKEQGGSGGGCRQEHDFRDKLSGLGDYWERSQGDSMISASITKQ